MKETLRRYPPLPVIPRVALQRLRVGRAFACRRRRWWWSSPIHTHHMRRVVAGAVALRPRALHAGRAEDEKHTHSWVPFGGGAHLCIGYRFAEVQVKSIMHQMLRGYRWSVPAGYRMPVQQAPISKPLDGLPVRLERL